MKPQDLRYSETHEWVKADGEVAILGITDYAVEHLSDLVFIELPEVGDDVAEGDAFGTIESVKAVSDLNSPVTGEVIEVNDALADELDLLANDPFGSGWLIKVKVSDPSEMDALISSTEYEVHLAKQEGG